LVLAALVRFDSVLASQLPLGDGGLFLRMVQTVSASSAGLPEFVDFNGEQIPFVYPALPFLVAGWLSRTLGVSEIAILHFLPAAISTATVPVFYLLARRVVGTGLASYAALAAWGLMPAAFEWLVAGGGLTRSFGMLFALGALTLAAGGADRIREPAGAGVLLGLAALSHPQVAIFATLGVVILASDGRPSRLRGLAVTGVVAALVVLPWLGLLVARGQLGALLAGGQRWNPLHELLLFLSLDFSGTQVFDVFLALGVAGIVVEVARGRWRIPAWIVGTYLASGGLFMVTVPWALAAGAAFQHLVAASITLRPAPQRFMPIAVGLTLLLVGLIAAQGSGFEDDSKRQALSSEQADAMEWVRTGSPPDARFAIVSTQTWANDLFGEWFPAMADRTSVGTPQGIEWLGPVAFSDRIERHQQLEACATGTSRCLAALVDADAMNGAAMFVVPKGRLAGVLSAEDCCPALRETMREDASFQIIYDGPGATIAEWVGQGAQ
jgi:hypothetical protein